MKLTLTHLFAVLICGTVFPLHAVDLKPKFETRVFDGEVIRLPYFADGEKRYGVITDGETEIGETATGAIFRFQTIPLASMTLGPSSIPTSRAFGADTEPLYREAALRMLPAGANEIVLDKVIPDPLPVNGWRSYRFVFLYNSQMGKIWESITFLNLTPEQQIVIRSASRAVDREAVAARSDDIISRWYEIRPGQDTYN